MIILAPLFLLTAVIYSSVGLGGGTTYIALLSFAGLPPNVISSTGLVLNIVVVTIGLVNFKKAGFLNLKDFWPLVMISVPGAFIGGQITLTKDIYYFLLSVLLIVLAMFTIFIKKKVNPKSPPIDTFSFLSMFAIGFALGLISGTFGIGGGIILAPILLLTGLADSKQAAALATVFILLNSASGIFGRFVSGNFAVPNIIFLGVAVAVGAYFGSKFGVAKLSRLTIQRTQGAILLIAGLRILLVLSIGA
jgi:hypothetical protein